MITVKLKIHDNKLNDFLEIIENLDNNIIEKIDYKLPQPKLPQTIYKPYTFDDFPLFKDLIFRDNQIFHKEKKVNTIQLITKYNTIISMIERMGLNISKTSKNNLVTKTITDIESVKDNKKRLKKDDFKAVSKIIDFSNSTSMVVTQNLPLLFDYAIEHKKSKNTYCLITFIGLEELMSNEVFNTIFKLIKRM